MLLDCNGNLCISYFGTSSQNLNTNNARRSDSEEIELLTGKLSNVRTKSKEGILTNYIYFLKNKLINYRIEYSCNPKIILEVDINFLFDSTKAAELFQACNELFVYYN